ncbi:Bacterial regulatory proteins, tetR family [Actinomyces bovis]|uniref:Bacterial regulatory proteins, tetR family n=1 Tax=Actinomyces bovis TaxID=1658 RepID=A0ABY1VK74_9ACTO|nr:Bacterial regulatory proteins, tetR family [Actinomyces bovis]VEG54212.1 Bacterial regulatory proteins, tetR family [Actinomyces israelii]
MVAARKAFGRDGYDTSLRGVARDAGVDPALVHHYFPERAKLFVESVLGSALGEGMDPSLLAGLDKLPPEQRGAELVRLFITQWDKLGADRFAAVIRAALGNSVVLARVRTLIVGALVMPVVARVAPDRAQLRAHLVVSQLIGLGLARWVAKLDAVAGASAEVLVAAVGPTIQRYMTGEIGGQADVEVGAAE